MSQSSSASTSRARAEPAAANAGSVRIGMGTASAAIRLRPDVGIVPLRREHAERMYRWMCDPAVSGNIGLRRTPSLATTLAWIDAALADPDMLPFAAMRDNQHVGNVILDRIDRYLGMCRLSVYIGEPSARGAGVGATATYLALHEAFRTLGLYKVWLTVHARNLPALATYARLGFIREGVLRGEFLLGQDRVDNLYMGLLRDDFFRLDANREGM